MAKTKKEAPAKAPQEEKKQTYINFFKNKESGKSTLVGPFKNEKGTEYYTSAFKDGQRVMIPATLKTKDGKEIPFVHQKNDGTGYFIRANEDFMKSFKLNTSKKEGDNWVAAGEVTLGEFGEFRNAQNKEYSEAKRAEYKAQKEAAEAGAVETEAVEAEGPEA